jgi:hypothetical protein
MIRTAAYSSGLIWSIFCFNDTVFRFACACIFEDVDCTSQKAFFICNAYFVFYEKDCRESPNIVSTEAVAPKATASQAAIADETCFVPGVRRPPSPTEAHGALKSVACLGKTQNPTTSKTRYDTWL